MKLDRVVVQHVDHDETSQAVVESLVTIGHTTGALVGAEYLETDEGIETF
ncbi:EAL domain-containing protein [Sulfobacillus harzensis]|uniref:EAL domain-containing protein n=1 Tax=Sulfobacillus harzensis TaxID=2729629 RepID=A0A7Y0L8W8_9FIRM|nr:EAL domain-containing protein [Sulfobacillus harzensis]